MILQLAESAVSIDGTSEELSTAASNLAQRTERTAATLVEISAAVTELSATASSLADRANEADRIMKSARTSAETSSKVVEKATTTMVEIENSSKAISKIVDIIENIAFQTNLLALNAGVEAARAGSEGRGFAVVATEVRALAQKSSDAAREITNLISATRNQIETGVSQVGEASGALNEIINLVGQISEQTSDITVASREQSSTITEISLAINELDKATQQNAQCSKRQLPRARNFPWNQVA